MGFADTLKKKMKDPKTQQKLSELSKKAQAKAKDPKTRAKIDKAVAKAKSKSKGKGKK